MASITGYTAEKMEQLANEQIVDGHITGDNLILERRDGGLIPAGDVRGPAGPPLEYDTGTWDEMQTASALIPGNYFRCEDQGVTYRSDGVGWVRVGGDPNVIYATDVGATPSPLGAIPSSTVLTKNTTRLNAAAEAIRVRTSGGGFVGAGTKLVLNGTTVGSTYYLNDELVSTLVYLLGVDGVLRVQFSDASGRVRIENVTAKGTALSVAQYAGGIAVATKFENLDVHADLKALDIQNCAKVQWKECDFYANWEGNESEADGAAIFIRNSFWITGKQWSAQHGGTVPTSNENRGPTAILIVASGGVGDVTSGPIKGIGQAILEDGVMNCSGIRFENRCRPGYSGNTSKLICKRIVTENQGNQPFLSVASTAAATEGHLLRPFIEDCERADGETTPAAIVIDNRYHGTGGSMSLAYGKMTGNGWYSQYVFACWGAGSDVSYMELEDVDAAVLLDPSHLPSNGGYGITTGGIGYHLRALPTFLTPGTPYNAYLLHRAQSSHIGVGMSNTEVLDRVGMFAEGHMAWSDGTLAHTGLFNEGQGQLNLKGLLAGTNDLRLRLSPFDNNGAAYLEFAGGGGSVGRWYKPRSSSEIRFQSNVVGEDMLVFDTARGIKLGTLNTHKVGYFGVAPVTQRATPTTLADVILGLQQFGLFA